MGALAVFFAHALAGVASTDERIVRAASIAMGLSAWFVILPLSVATVATGLIQAYTSAWGLLRHYWLVFKLFLTAIATLVLLLKLAPMNQLAAAALAEGSSIGDLAGLRVSLLLHAAGGLGILLAITALAVYKPAGITPFAGRPGTMPHWAKIFSGVALVLLIVLIAMILLGGHGPHAHR